MVVEISLVVPKMRPLVVFYLTLISIKLFPATFLCFFQNFWHIFSIFSVKLESYLGIKNVWYPWGCSTEINYYFSHYYRKSEECPIFGIFFIIFQIGKLCARPNEANRLFKYLTLVLMSFVNFTSNVSFIWCCYF